MGLRTIYLTGGYGPDAVVVDVAGADLTGATLKLALLPESLVDPPPATDLRWTAVIPAADRSLKLPVGAAQGSGHWHVWLQISLGGAIIPLRVLDPDDGLPLHVQTI